MHPALIGAMVGGGAGAASSMFDRADKKKQPKDSGNVFAQHQDNASAALRDYLTRGAQAGSQEVLADPVYGKQYGAGGQLDLLGGDIASTRAEEADLRGRGYSLQPEDYEAYGQASGNIARMFGQQDANLASALRARGLSSSGSAQTAFSGALGNKMERLGAMQRQIADQRMQSNLARLGQTRQHINSLLGQQRGMVGDYGQAVAHKDQFAESKGQMGQSTLSNLQNQANQNFEQQKATHVGSFGGDLFKGTLGGAMMGAQLGSAMGGGGGAGTDVSNLGKVSSANSLQMSNPNSKYGLGK